MHLRSSVVLGTVLALLLSLHAISGAANSKRVQVLTSSRSDVRLLRTVGQENEERILGLDQVSGLMKSGLAKVKLNKDLRTWQNQKKSASQVLDLLKLDDGVDNLISNPNLKGLAKYVLMFNKQNPQSQVTVVETLATRYGEDVVAQMIQVAKNSPKTMKMATKLETEQVRIWIAKGKSADNIFTRLKLNDPATLPVGGPRFDALANYINVFNHRFTDKKTTMLDTFMKTYDDRQLASLIYGAMKVKKTQRAAKELENAQFSMWFQRNAPVQPRKFFRKVLKIKTGTVPTNTDKEIFIQYSQFWGMKQR